jgi:predicted acylesterase/phospholipase RssA
MSETTAASKTAIVLSGGGALGAFEAGVLAGLSKRVNFDIVCGTSIGAINGALVAQGAFDELAQLWQTISTLNIVRYVDLVQKVSGFIDDVEGLQGKALAVLGNFHLVNAWCKIGSKKALLALRGVYDPGPIETLLTSILSLPALKSTLIISTTNLTNGTSDAFYQFVNATNEDVDRFRASRAPDPCYPLSTANYLIAVRASMSIPGAFEPVDMNLGQSGVNHDYVDGGVANNTPVNLAVAAPLCNNAFSNSICGRLKPAEQ